MAANPPQNPTGRAVQRQQHAIKNPGTTLGEVNFEYEDGQADRIFGNHGHTTKVDGFVVISNKRISDGFSNCSISTLVDSACCRRCVMSTTYGIDTTSTTWNLLADFLRRNCNPAIYVLSTNEEGGHNVSRHSIHNTNLRSFLASISSSAPASTKISVGPNTSETGIILNGAWIIGVGMTVYTHNVPHTVTEFAQAIVDGTPYLERIFGKCFSCK